MISLSVGKVRTFLEMFFFLLGPRKSKFFQIIGAFLALSILDVFGIGLIGPYISLLSDPNSFEAFGLLSRISQYLNISEYSKLMMFLGGILLIVFIVKLLCSVSISYLIYKFCYGNSADLRVRLMNVYQNMDYSRFVERNSSEYIQALQSYVDLHMEYTMLCLMRIIGESIVAMAILVFLAISNPVALLLLILVISITALVYERFFRREMMFNGKRANSHMETILKTLSEAMTGIREARILGIEKYFRNILRTHSAEHSRYKTKAKVVMAAPRFVLETVLMAYVVIMVAVVLWMGGDTTRLMASLGVLAFAAVRLLPGINVLMAGMVTLRVGRDATQRIYADLLEGEKSTPNSSRSSAVIESEEGRVDSVQFDSFSFDQVSFSYDCSKPAIFKDVSISINRGDYVALVGNSGSGKTTFLNLMLGLLRATSGDLYFNGEKVTEKNVARWISSVAYLPQTPFLLDDSLRRNIALGIKDNCIDDDKIIKCLEQAKIANILPNLENGLNTNLGEGGGKLSGGQKQRMVLARAFYHDRDVLILDESTSALDSKTEKDILDEIEEFKGQKTIVIITHREEILSRCNKIFKISDRRVEQIDTNI